MTPSNQRVLVTKAARAVVVELAPGELADFAETAEEFWRSPHRVRGLYGDDDAMIGFGGLELAIIAPAALYIAAEVTKFLLESVKGALGELIGESFKSLLPRRPGAPRELKPDTPTPIQLSAEQLVEVRKAGLKAARELGLPAARSELLVNAVVMHVVRVAAGEGKVLS